MASSKLSRRIDYAIVSIIALTITVNVIQFDEGGNGEGWGAVRLAESQPSLQDTNGLKGRYAPFVYIRNNSVEPILFTPYTPIRVSENITRKDIFKQRMVGIARIEEVFVRDYSQQRVLNDIEGLIPSFHGNYSSEVKRTWKRHQYEVYRESSGRVNEWVYTSKGYTDIFVDTRLLSDELLGDLHK